jgi:UDP-N-acetylmuramate--alanine ligase
MGVGGAGMNPLAAMVHSRGIVVTGCDLDPSGADDLVARGVAVEQGHDPSHVDDVRAVVVTAAVPSDHPELERARELGLPILPRKRLLAELVAGACVVGVSGTHGKTTTTAMATDALSAADLDPTGIAGGRVRSWGGNVRIGSPGLYVVEADEYDQAFLELHPTVAVVTNVEADHLDSYGSVAAMESAFVQFAERAERVIAGTDDPGDLAITALEQTPGGTTATVSVPERGTVQLRLRVPGLHNVKNAVAALGVVAALEAPLEPALEALAAFDGVGRRFERLGEAEGVEVVDDYAHHPTEVRATIQAARQMFPDRRLVAVFQPHLYSRTERLGDALGEALGAADVVVVTDVYAAREQPLAGVSGQRVADAARQSGATAIYEPDRARVSRRVREVIERGDLLLTLGAGDITRVGRELVEWPAVA